MALGKTSLKKGDNIDALLGKSPQPKPQPLSKSSPRNTNVTVKATIIKAAKLTDDEIEKIDLVKKMLGTDNTSEALRWCIKAAWNTYGDKIQEIVDKKESVSSIKI
jgi:rubrerythrin